MFKQTPFKKETIRRSLTYLAQAVLFGDIILIFFCNTAYASISQGYSGNNLVPGMLVSLKSSSASDLEAASIANSDLLLGVVVESESTTLEVSNDGDSVQVAQTGDALLFVSTLGGDVAPGDYLGPSEVEGVAKKVAPESRSKIIGVANAALTATTSGAAKKTSNDLGKDFYIAKMPVRIAIGELIGASGAALTLQTAGQRLIGKPISFFQAAVAALIFLISATVGVIILSSGIRGSLVSLGRNPLAVKAIYGHMFRITGIAVLVLVFGSSASYGVLLL